MIARVRAAVRHRNRLIMDTAAWISGLTFDDVEKMVTSGHVTVEMRTLMRHLELFAHIVDNSPINYDDKDATADERREEALFFRTYGKVVDLITMSGSAGGTLSQLHSSMTPLKRTVLPEVLATLVEKGYFIVEGDGPARRYTLAAS